MTPGYLIALIMGCVILIGLNIMIAGVILRYACWIYNHLAGTHPAPAFYSPDAWPSHQLAPPPSFGPPPEPTKPQTVDSPAKPAPGLISRGDETHPNGVPEPSWGFACVIVAVAFAVNFVFYWATEQALVQRLIGHVGSDVLFAVTIGRIVALYLISTFIIAAMLNIHYLRAFLVTLLQILIGGVVQGLLLWMIFVLSGFQIWLFAS